MMFNCNKLKEARGRAGLTLEEMAKILDMDSSAYWRLEAGKTKVKAEQLIRFMEVFNQPYAYFFESSKKDRIIKLEVEVIPEKLKMMVRFLKDNPGIVRDWEQCILKLEQELYSTNF